MLKYEFFNNTNNIYQNVNHPQLPLILIVISAQTLSYYCQIKFPTSITFDKISIFSIPQFKDLNFLIYTSTTTH